MGTERQRRGTRLTPEDKWQIFLETSRKNTTGVLEVCRKWGITTWQLKAIRTKAKDGSLEAFRKGPGRRKADQQVTDEKVQRGRATLSQVKSATHD